MNHRKRLAEILARMAEIKADIAQVEALDAPTADDATRAEAALTEWDTLEAERADVAAKVEKLDRIAASVTDAPASVRVEGGFSAPAVHVRDNPFGDVESQVRNESIGRRANPDAVGRALQAFESRENVRELTRAQQENLVELVERTPGAAEYALAHGDPNYRSAFDKIAIAGGATNLDFTQEERDAVAKAKTIRAALNITTGNSGQFSLPTVFDPTLIHTGTAAINPIRPLSRVVTGTQNVWNGVSVGNVSTYWHAEGVALTDGSPTLAHPIVTAGHLTGYVVGSWEFFDDSGMVAQLPGLIGEAFDYAEATAFVTGSGTSQPKGFVTATSATAGSLVTATTRGKFDSTSAVDVFAIMNSVASRYENTSTWAANKATFNSVRQMSSSGAGSFFWGNFDAGVTPNQPYPLLGSATINCSDILSTTTTGTVLIALGDFSQYLILDVLGSTVEFVQNVVNSSGLPTGQRGLAVRKRVGADVTDANAFRIYHT